MAKSGNRWEIFDLRELAGHLTRTITDKVYREYRQDLKEQYENNRKCDAKPENDLEVPDELIHDIKNEIETRTKEEVSNAVMREISREIEEQYHPAKKFEQITDKGIQFVRWLAIPYLLMTIFPMLAITFLIGIEIKELGSFIFEYFRESSAHHSDNNGKSGLSSSVSAILSILDLILLGSLVIMVLVGGYENTVARIGMTHGVPAWFGKLGIGQLKIKVAASIVIISSIHLLTGFMRVNVDIDTPLNSDALYWTAVIHGVFVASAVALSFMEYIHALSEKIKTGGKEPKSSSSLRKEYKSI